MADCACLRMSARVCLRMFICACLSAFGCLRMAVCAWLSAHVYLHMFVSAWLSVHGCLRMAVCSCLSSCEEFRNKLQIFLFCFFCCFYNFFSYVRKRTKKYISHEYMQQDTLQYFMSWIPDRPVSFFGQRRGPQVFSVKKKQQVPWPLPNI